jgi:hypothetical protein
MMMKCLILCKDEQASWITKYIRKESPYMLKFVTKPLLEFYIDLASLSGIKELRIVNDAPNTDIEKYFNRGEKWGLDITYSISKEGDSIEQTLKKNSSFAGDDDLLVFYGFIFVHYDRNLKKSPFVYAKSPLCIKTENGGIYKLPSKSSLKNMKTYKEDDISVSSIAGLADFYQISMDILKNRTANYVLPGYNNEPGIYIGQNVEISRNTKINPPVIISDNVRLKELSSIGPNAVIGHNVLIDKAAIVKDSIIYDASYVGLDLEVKEKFIYKQKLADIKTGEVIEISDNFLISELGNTQIANKPIFIFHFLGAFILALCMLPSYIILRIIQLITGDVKYITKSYHADSKSDKPIVLTIPERYHGMNLFNHLFFKLSIFKFPLLLKVLTGKLDLVGNAPKEITESSRDDIDELSLYVPAVFSYSEMLQTAKSEPFETQINELYYSSNRSFIFNITIIIKSLIGNLFK